MNLNDSRKYQAEKDHLMRNEGTHPANDIFKNWRSPQAESEDKARLAKDQNDLSELEKRRVLVGGGEKHSGMFGEGASDTQLREKREKIEREEKDERSYR